MGGPDESNLALPNGNPGILDVTPLLAFWIYGPGQNKFKLSEYHAAGYGLIYIAKKTNLL